MKIKNRVCITFAGTPGSSKTPIAYFLSWKFNLPIINNDSMRTEVTEDILSFDVTEYEKRRDQRLQEILESKETFIYDASIDRRWPDFKKWLQEGGYQWFIISMDLDKKLLEKIYTAKKYEQIHMLDRFINDHNNFLKDFPDEVDVHITDQTFPNRLELSAKSFEEWLKVNNFVY